MKILGISNQNFIGVTVATRAICTEYYPVAHQNDERAAAHLGRQIAKFNPDLLVVGGWSQGYGVVLSEMHKHRKFPVINVYHSTIFHGTFFGDDVYYPQIVACHKKGAIDLLGFVQPQQVEYYQKVKNEYAIWVPHYFKQLQKIKKHKKFCIGVLGGTGSWFKNGYGAHEVAKDYTMNNPGTEVLASYSYDKMHHHFLHMLAGCSVLVHISHLECYPNVVQEAWSMGIPVILSQASVGLVNNPLLNFEERCALRDMVLSSNIDAYELYKTIEKIHKNWDHYSQLVHSIHEKVSKRAGAYTDKLFAKIIEGYKNRSMDKSFLRMPFEKPDQLWL